jgi:hypothetical protein
MNVLTTERHTFVKENDKLRVVARMAKQQGAKMKSDNQILLEERKQLISMNAKGTADQQTCQELISSWQSDADKP